MSEETENREARGHLILPLKTEDKSLTYLSNWRYQEAPSRLEMCWQGHDDYKTNKQKRYFKYLA